MTDEEIEKALKCCITNQSCEDCPCNVYRQPLYEDEEAFDQIRDCKDFQATSLDLLKGALSCITRLKEENTKLKQEKKDILQDWYDDVVHGMGVEGYYIKEYAERHGIAIEE